MLIPFRKLKAYPKSWKPSYWKFKTTSIQHNPTTPIQILPSPFTHKKCNVSLAFKNCSNGWEEYWNEMTRNLILQLINIHFSHTKTNSCCISLIFVLLNIHLPILPWISLYEWYKFCPPFLVNVGLSSYEHTHTIIVSLLLVSFPLHSSLVSFVTITLSHWTRNALLPDTYFFLLPTFLSMHKYCCWN